VLLQVVIWWLLIQILGLAALPLAYRLFRWLPGRGYPFAKPLGLLLTSYVLWIGASLGYLKNTSGGILIAVAATAGISIWFYSRRTQANGDSLTTFLRERWRLILTVEILFTVAFGAWALLRAYAPDKIMTSGGEKFMEIAFLNATLESAEFPPHDPWLSGFAISYYYFGYVMMALLTRLSGVVSGVGFELCGALTFALTVTGAFGVVYSLVAGQTSRSSNDRQPLRYGVLGSLFVAVMGNLEGLLEALYARGLLPDRFWRWIDIPSLTEAGQVTGSLYPGHGWWWWRASRVLRDRNVLGEPMPLNPIDEFPFFSFLLGDNHPHVLALPFVLLAIALALNLLRRQWKPTRSENHDAPWWNPAAYCLDGDWGLFATYALGLGALGFLNTWDYPIYLGLTALAYGAGRYTATAEPLSRVLQRTLVLGVSLTLVGILLYLPFYVGFSSQAGGVLPYLLPPTRLAQYLVMFGPFIFVAAWFLLAKLLTSDDSVQALISAAQSWAVVVAVPLLGLILALSVVVVTEPGRQFIQGILSDPRIQPIVGSAGPGPAVRAILLARLRDPWLFLTLSLLIAVAAVHILHPRRGRGRSRWTAPSDQFAALLFFCGLALTFVVEFLYLRDSFGVRMNTIFKFYYQAWVMLACASAYAIWWVLTDIGGRLGDAIQTIFLLGTALLVAAGMVYPLMASYSRVWGFDTEPNLNGAINIAQSHPDDWAAIEWLRANAEGSLPVILEAPGGSYEYEGRISAFTGYPAVLGWALHESQWRGNYVEQGKREPDIQAIYTTADDRETLELLHKWDVDYVILGPPERRFAEELCSAPERQCTAPQALQKFDSLLNLVFKQGQTAIYHVPEP
jgi:YYY domain-containing protein